MENPRIAPFPFEELGNGKCRAKWEDIVAAVKSRFPKEEWEGPGVLVASNADYWLDKLNVLWDNTAIPLYEVHSERNGPKIVEWTIGTELVSLQDIREAFLGDLNMRLSCELNPIMVLEIYHVEDADDAPNDMCFALLEVGKEEIRSTPACSTLLGDSHPLDEIIQAFQLDIHQPVWTVGEAE